MVSLSDTTLYLCYRRHTAFHTQRYFLWLHHLFRSHWRLWPSRRRNRSRVTQRLISADIHKLCRERARVLASVWYRIITMALRIWKLSRVSMTLPQQLGWLGETRQACWCIFPLFLKIFQLFFFSFGHPEVHHPPRLPSFFQACPQFSSLVHCPQFFSPFFNQSDRPSSPSPPHRPLRTNWAL